MLTDKDITEIMDRGDVVEGNRFLPYAYARAVIAACEAKLREQEPIAYINVNSRELEWAKPTTFATPRSIDLAPVPLYMRPPPAPIPEGVQDFIHQFKRHVGGDGEFWLHELEDFYDKMAARSGE